jgi:hypothetical protein
MELPKEPDSASDDGVRTNRQNFGEEACLGTHVQLTAVDLANMRLEYHKKCTKTLIAMGIRGRSGFLFMISLATKLTLVPGGGCTCGQQLYKDKATKDIGKTRITGLDLRLTSRMLLYPPVVKDTTEDYVERYEYFLPKRNTGQ